MAPERSSFYRGELSPLQAASAMQAARKNSLDLLDTAEVLFNLSRFAHSITFSILAIEENGKLPLLQMIFLGFGGKTADLWKEYRNHRAKTEYLNQGIRSRIRVNFPNAPLEKVDEIAARGPTPDDLEFSKQRTLYSDCFEDADGVACHLPRMVDWRQMAWERLCEAKAIVLAPRDYSPEELEVWLKHAKEAQSKDGDMASMLEPLHKELLAKGFVKEGWWNILLSEVKREQAKQSDKSEKT